MKSCKEKAGGTTTDSIIILTFWIPPFYLCLSIQDNVCLELVHTDKPVKTESLCILEKNYSATVGI